MDAGRELDALVAEKVMGWHKELLAGRFYWFGPYDGRSNPRMDCTGVDIGQTAVLAFAEGSDVERFAPSTDIAAAWQVVEHLTAGEEGWIFKLTTHVDGWQASFGIQHSATATTAPLAICQAALAAVAAGSHTTPA